MAAKGYKSCSTIDLPSTNSRAISFDKQYSYFLKTSVNYHVITMLTFTMLTFPLSGRKTKLVIEKLTIRLLIIDQEYVNIKKNKCMIIMYAYIAISMQNIFWYILYVINHPTLLSSTLFMLLNHANAFTSIADKISVIATALAPTTMLVF